MFCLNRTLYLYKNFIAFQALAAKEGRKRKKSWKRGAWEARKEKERDWGEEDSEKKQGSTQQIHFLKQNMCFASTSWNRLGARIVWETWVWQSRKTSSDFLTLGNRLKELNACSCFSALDTGWVKEAVAQWGGGGCEGREEAKETQIEEQAKQEIWKGIKSKGGERNCRIQLPVNTLWQVKPPVLQIEGMRGMSGSSWSS